ncbi:hypothetical protein [Halorientalis marina]|jgi:hypothetical protein|uniref:hypothetical protein n=1 Tax=Halorientalis marina TaxID=2931976 RepID=UPI001FF402FC|nr:hypothetical protein [Halorientalis marina]
MERGTDWEREAVARQWAVMERRRRQGTRLLGGVGLLTLGAICLFLGTASAACVGDNGVVPTCTAIVPGPVATVFLATGVVALAGGAWRCWSALG